MKNLRVTIPEEELSAIIRGESNAVEFPLLPTNFHTCCDMLIAGQKFDSIEEAMAIPEMNSWLEDNDLELVPVSYASLELHTKENDKKYLLPIEEIEMSYINEKDGTPLFTLVNGIQYRKIMMKYKIHLR